VEVRIGVRVRDKDRVRKDEHSLDLGVRVRFIMVYEIT
jgi:hypothetical protein